MGLYHYWGYLDYDRALAEFAIAQKSQPNSSDLFGAIGYVQRRQGKFVQALANLKKASDLDPQDGGFAADLGVTYSLLRNPVEAAHHFDRAISLSPDWPVAYGEKARFVRLHLEGNTERARAVLEQARSVGLAENPLLTYTWVLLEMLDGEYQEALDRLAVVSSDVLLGGQNRYVPKTQLYAQIHGLMGNRQREQAYSNSNNMVNWYKNWYKSSITKTPGFKPGVF